MQLRFLSFRLRYLLCNVRLKLLVSHLVPLLGPRQVVNDLSDLGLLELQVQVLSDPPQITVGQLLLSLQVHQLEHLPPAVFSAVMPLSQKIITILSVMPVKKSSK